MVCCDRLAVSESELQTMVWPTLVDKIVELQQHEQLCSVRQLSAHDIVSRIMRKENYLIGMLNKEVLGLDLPSSVRGIGLLLNHDKKPLVFTKMIEWSLNWCIFEQMFDRQVLVDQFCHRLFLCSMCMFGKLVCMLFKLDEQQ